MHRREWFICCAVGLFPCAGLFAQMPGVTPEMIRMALPLEGAPRAQHGPYEVLAEAAFESPRHIVYRPADLRAFPVEDSLPVVIWGNGGCALNSERYDGWLTTIASHGFVVIATTTIDGEPTRRATTGDLRQAIDWVEAESARDGAAIAGKVGIDEIAAMGTSCGGYIAVELGSDPRVDTIGVFNSGVQPADWADRSPTAPAFDALAGIHGPVLLINGGEKDFLMGASHDTFAALDHVPAFYGARENAGHSATIFHPGGGEFANVAVNWLRFIFKSDSAAERWFVGDQCGLCANPTWETDSSGLTATAIQTASTERVVMRHLAASEAGDASVIPRDYAEDAMVIFGGTPSVGLTAVQTVFDNLYARTRLDMDYQTRTFHGNTGYIVYTMEGLTGSDTFIVRDGKIVMQTGVVVRTQ